MGDYTVKRLKALALLFLVLIVAAPALAQSWVPAGDTVKVNTMRDAEFMFRWAAAATNVNSSILNLSACTTTSPTGTVKATATASITVGTGANYRVQSCDSKEDNAVCQPLAGFPTTGSVVNQSLPVSYVKVTVAAGGSLPGEVRVKCTDVNNQSWDPVTNAWVTTQRSLAGTVPGLRGNTATDPTIAYIYAMQHFEAYPDYQRYYFSEGTAGGFYPAGSDANPCTEALPCRTIEKMTALLNRGQVWIIMDAGDDWDLAADWGTANDITVTDPPACTGMDPSEACDVVSSSSFSPADKFRLNCANIVEPAGPGLWEWVDNDGIDHGWLAVENVEMTGCPPTINGSTDFDLFRTDGVGGPSKMVILNATVLDGVHGSDASNGQNDFYTSHAVSADGLRSGVGVFLNANAFVANSGVGYAADTFDATNGDMIVIGNTELYSLDTDGPWDCFRGNNAAGAEYTFIGHTCNDRQGIQLQSAVLNNYAQQAGAASRLFLADLTFKGWDGGTIGGTQSGDVITNVGGVNFANTSMYIQLFRDTFSGFEQGIGETGAGIPGNDTYTVQGRCLLMENPTATGRFINMYNGSGRSVGDMANITIDVQGLYDDEPNGVDYNFVGNTYNTAPLADAALGPSQHVFDTASFDSGGDGVNGDAFGALAGQLMCNTTDCLKQCSADNVSNWTFVRWEIPKVVLGTPIKSLSLGGNVRNFGSR